MSGQETGITGQEPPEEHGTRRPAHQESLGIEEIAVITDKLQQGRLQPEEIEEIYARAEVGLGQIGEDNNPALTKALTELQMRIMFQNAGMPQDEIEKAITRMRERWGLPSTGPEPIPSNSSVDVRGRHERERNEQEKLLEFLREQTQRSQIPFDPLGRPREKILHAVIKGYYHPEEMPVTEQNLKQSPQPELRPLTPQEERYFELLQQRIQTAAGHNDTRLPEEKRLHIAAGKLYRELGRKR